MVNGVSSARVTGVDGAGLPSESSMGAEAGTGVEAEGISSGAAKGKSFTESFVLDSGCEALASEFPFSFDGVASVVLIW